jgi:TRAP-type C4-dicarboxylate transport system permease small subunit
MWLNRAIYTLNRGANPLVRITKNVAAGILAAMMFLTAMDVLLRYIFNRPISGALEITEFMMVIIVGFGLSYCVTVKGLVSVEIFTSHFSPRAQAILNTITYFLSFIFFSLITWQSMRNVKLVFETDLVSPVLFIPTFPFAVMLALGCLVFTLVLLINFLEFLSQAVTK